MRASQAIPGPWLDTAAKPTPAVYQAVSRAGFRGIFRYVPLPANDASYDISGLELGSILDAGLQCGLVQHVRKPPWLPKNHPGQGDGEVAHGFALTVGYPLGAHLFLDLEGCAGTPDDTKAFCNAWAAEVRSSGYRAGLYVGYLSLLTPQELYELPDFDCYWKDAGPREVATRGFAVRQGPAMTVGGVQFDTDVVAADALGGLPTVAG